MVAREGDFIVSDEREQRLFSVPALMGVSLALDTAEAFAQAAGSVHGVVAGLQTEAHDTPTAIADLDQQRRSVRVGLLMTYAMAVQRLCPDEVVARMFAELGVKEA